MHRLHVLRIATPAMFLAGVACSPAVHAGQTTRTVDAGTRVRVRLERNPLPLVGSIAEVRQDTLIVTRQPMPLERRTTVAFSDIAALEVSTGHRRLTVIGVAVGAVAGLTLTAAYNGIVQSQCFSDCPGRVSTGIGAAVGGIALGGAFHFIRIERWVPIAVPAPHSAGR